MATHQSLLDGYEMDALDELGGGWRAGRRPAGRFRATAGNGRRAVSDSIFNTPPIHGYPYSPLDPTPSPQLHQQPFVEPLLTHDMYSFDTWPPRRGPPPSFLEATRSTPEEGRIPLSASQAPSFIPGAASHQGSYALDGAGDDGPPAQGPPRASPRYGSPTAEPGHVAVDKMISFWRSQGLLRNVIIGFSDGLTMPFALAAGFSSLGSNRMAILGGIAEVVSGCLSMAFGAYLAAATEQKRYRVAEKEEREGMASSSVASEWLGAHGANEALYTPTRLQHEVAADPERQLRRYAWHIDQGLWCLFDEFGATYEDVAGLAWRLAAHSDRYVKFTMRFQHSLDEHEGERPFAEALLMAMAYATGGMVPLIPYMLIKRIKLALAISTCLTAVALIALGYTRTAVVGCRMWDRVIGALQTLVLGLTIGVLSYFTIWSLEAFLRGKG